MGECIPILKETIKKTFQIIITMPPIPEKIVQAS